MKILSRAFCTALLLASACPTLASVSYQDIVSAATNSQDLSRQALVTVFGDVVTDPLAGSSTSLIGNLFGLFNGIMAILAVVWFMFIGLRHIVKTGHQGQAFNSGRDIVGTLSIVAGFLTIVPTGNGWSLAQLIMLWASSIMGIGSANLMVQAAANDIASGYSMTVQPVQSSTRTAARGIFEMQLCKHAINSALADFNSTTKSSTSEMTESSGESGGNYTVKISNGSGVCGTASIPVEGDGSNNSSFWSFLNPFSSSDYSGVISTQRSAMETMVSELDGTASEFVAGYLQRRDNDSGSLPDIESKIQAAANAYESTVQSALPKDDDTARYQDSLKSYIDTYGWVTLGAWYQTFATANQRVAELANRAPSTTSMSSLGEVGDTDLFKSVMQAYQTQLQNSTYAPPLGTSTSENEMNAGQASDSSTVIMKTIGPGMTYLTNKIATSWTGSGTSSNQVNPLIKMKNVGDYTLVTTEGAWASYWLARVVVSGGVKSLFGKIVDGATGAGSALEKGLDAMSPTVHFLLFLMFTAGFSLSIYLPFIPFICWMTGVGNWVVSVLVGCTAGPLWAATHLGTSADTGSRAAYGYIYLIDMMIRPALMVFGFFFASVAIVAAGTILHVLFGAALANVQTNSFTGLFSLAGFLLIYARICTTLVANMFALQAYLPDYVITFLGGREAANTLGNMASSVRDIIAAGNRNVRHTPGAKSQGQAPADKGDNNKDGINDGKK
ncbi:DotA/TraY family protein [Salmonella enterica subsp. enterica serovar Legon]|nr:DotA/TraY family protein [Salmonella enterica subsp. enterica serovar Legon]EDW9825499.1 DotA/TraY family protein [Salmonella enterica]